MNISIFPKESIYTEEAEALANELDITLTDTAPTSGAFLALGGDGLSLCEGELSVRGDFEKLLPRIKTSNLQQEFLVKAAKIKGMAGPVTVLDATAGLGEDSFILAAAGFNVIMYEYDRLIAALLRDALRRASAVPAISDVISRMEFHFGDSIEAMRCLEHEPDVILLDPMFPERTKSASVKKKFQLLHVLESPCTSEEELLDAAISAHPRRIIIKRPAKGAYLAGRKPSYSLSGKAVRYDCLVFAKD